MSLQENFINLNFQEFVALNCSRCNNSSICSLNQKQINICYESLGPEKDCLFCGLKITESNLKTLYHKNKDGQIETGHMHLKCFQELKEEL